MFLPSFLTSLRPIIEDEQARCASHIEGAVIAGSLNY